MATTDTRRSGTQSIERALAVIRDVAAHHQLGARLTDIAERCGMDMGTTCRVLACLVREHVVEQRASDKRYLPGQGLFELGLTVPAYRALQEACRQPMERVARRFKGVSFVYLRSGTEVVCVARSDHVLIHSAWGQPGTRRPMPALAAGLAVLSQLPDEEADEIVKAYFKQLAQQKRVNAVERRRMVQRSRKLGYGFNDGNVARGLVSVAVPIHNPEGVPFASISVVNIDNPSFAQRADDIAESMRKDSLLITERLAMQMDSTHFVQDD
ncbi:MAG: IclR family transcriptional regulator [Comamonadaceae bacterium]|nr:IclR family transcriptional regulator [Comamonadaceae bacterium]